jgi:DNA-binding XRE family transcriptional regulator
MSPETTTPTDIGRPKRRKVAAQPSAPAPVVEVPKAASAPEVRRRRGQPNPPPDMTMLVPPKVQRRVGPAMTALLHAAGRGCALTKIGVTPIADGYLWTGEQADDDLHAQFDTKKAEWSQHHQRTISLRMQAVQRARVRPIDLQARKKEVDDNLVALRRCPAYSGVPDAVWQAGLETIAKGLSTVNQWNDELVLPKSTLSYWMRRHGVNSKLLPDFLSHRGRHPHTTGTNKSSELGLIFGRGVRRQRAIYGLTQIELAVALRIHSTMMPCIEQGIVQPRVELVRRLTDLFKVPWRSLFDIDDVRLLTLLVAGVAEGARNHCCGDLLRHLVLPAFGVEVPRLTDHQKRVVKGYRADKSCSQTPRPLRPLLADASRPGPPASASGRA